MYEAIKEDADIAIGQYDGLLDKDDILEKTTYIQKKYIPTSVDPFANSDTNTLKYFLSNNRICLNLSWFLCSNSLLVIAVAPEASELTSTKCELSLEVVGPLACDIS